MKKLVAALVSLTVLLCALPALASVAPAAPAPLSSLLYVGGGLVVISSVLVAFDQRLD